MVARIKGSVDVDDNGCWIWKYGKVGLGYGKIQVDGKTLRAHRVAYETFIGPIPEGHSVLHKCDVPPCCNPEHLTTGTDKDNHDDMRSKGRRGSPNKGKSFRRRWDHLKSA